MRYHGISRASASIAEPEPVTTRPIATPMQGGSGFCSLTIYVISVPATGAPELGM